MFDIKMPIVFAVRRRKYALLTGVLDVTPGMIE
jgi:hypothetical protein